MRYLNLVLIIGIFLFLSACAVKKTQKDSSPITQYEANWESLQNYEIPSWFQDAKFGIFIHWGPYSVPAYGSEWYGRNMYMDTATFNAQLKHQKDGPNEIYAYHKKTWGDPKDFGYKNFIPLFKGENFDAGQWIDLFKKSGAKYVVPVAEHHDGFAMYNSQFTRWNAAEMGPKKDILGELFAEGRRQGLKMGASSHFAFNWSYFNKKSHFDTSDPAYADLYGTKGPHLDEPISEEFKTLWWNRTTDIIDNYQPDILWFDFFWDKEEFKSYHPRLAAHYYNKALEWNKEVVLQDKNFHYEAFPEGTFVHDLERGKMSDIRKLPWQTDTSVGKNSWGYVTNWISKDANKLVDDLVDITSKNGCMLLNVGPKSDGTIPEEQQKILLEIGEWLAINGEAMYGSRYWETYGEGPTKVEEGYMSERKKNLPFTAEDIRFTTKGDALYAILMDWPENHEILISSLRQDKVKVRNVELLGSNSKLIWKSTDQGLEVKLPSEKPCEHAFTLKITQ